MTSDYNQCATIYVTYVLFCDRMPNILTFSKAYGVSMLLRHFLIILRIQAYKTFGLRVTSGLQSL